MIFGTIEIVTTRQAVGDKIFMGSYAIHRDREGRETRRTPNEWNIVLDCGSTLEAKRLDSLDI
jgi:hypothetical protein